MSASDGTQGSEPAPSPSSEADRRAVPFRTIGGVRDPLSKITGAGVGAAIIALAHSFNVSDHTKLIASECGLAAGALITAFGPQFRDVLVRHYRERGAQRLMKKIEKLALDDPDDPILKAKVKEARNIILDAWSDKLKQWRDDGKHGDPPKRR